MGLLRDFYSPGVARTTFRGENIVIISEARYEELKEKECLYTDLGFIESFMKSNYFDKLWDWVIEGYDPDRFIEHPELEAFSPFDVDNKDALHIRIRDPELFENFVKYFHFLYTYVNELDPETASELKETFRAFLRKDESLYEDLYEKLSDILGGDPYEISFAPVMAELKAAVE
jgi:hypothetical protein